MLEKIYDEGIINVPPWIRLVSEVSDFRDIEYDGAMTKLFDWNKYFYWSLS